VNTEKSCEIGLPERSVRERWQEFQRSKAELSNAEARFEALGENRTRVTLAGEDPSVEGTVDEFRKFVDVTSGAGRTRLR
jgi:hypothetical protein